MQPYMVPAAAPAAPLAEFPRSQRGTVVLSIDGTDQENLKSGVMLIGLLLLVTGIAIGRWTR